MCDTRKAIYPEISCQLMKYDKANNKFSWLTSLDTSYDMLNFEVQEYSFMIIIEIIRF